MRTDLLLAGCAAACAAFAAAGYSTGVRAGEARGAAGVRRDIAAVLDLVSEERPEIAAAIAAVEAADATPPLIALHRGSASWSRFLDDWEEYPKLAADLAALSDLGLVSIGRAADLQSAGLTPLGSDVATEIDCRPCRDARARQLDALAELSRDSER